MLSDQPRSAQHGTTNGTTAQLGVASWTAAPEPAGVDVVGYRAIVERERPLRVFNTDLAASVTSVTIPAEFLEPGTEYKLEVQAIDKSGNQTISEITFLVS